MRLKRAKRETGYSESFATCEFFSIPDIGDYLAIQLLF